MRKQGVLSKTGIFILVLHTLIKRSDSTKCLTLSSFVPQTLDAILTLPNIGLYGCFRGCVNRPRCQAVTYDYGGSKCVINAKAAYGYNMTNGTVRIQSFNKVNIPQEIRNTPNCANNCAGNGQCVKTVNSGTICMHSATHTTPTPGIGYILFYNLATHEDAGLACAQGGGHLLTLDTHNKTSTFTSLLETKYTNVTSVWVDGEYDNVTNSWMTSRGPLSIHSLNIKLGVPLKKECVALEKYVGMVSRDCSTHIGFICQRA